MNEKLDVKTELKIVMQFTKIFPVREPEESLLYTEMNDQTLFLDPSNVCGCIVHDERMKIILQRFTTKTNNKVPDLKFDKSGGSTFSIEYLSEIFKCFKIVDDNPTLFVQKDYPMRIQGKYFSFVLAPKVNN